MAAATLSTKVYTKLDSVRSLCDPRFNRKVKKLMTMVKVAYFSGTGGAKRIAEYAASQFEENNCVVDIERIGVASRGECASGRYDLLVLVSVVHEFNFPYLVRKWVSSLEDGAYSKAAVFSVSGGGRAVGNRGAQGEVIKALEKQDIPVVFDEIFVMPSNFFYRIKHPVDAMLMDAYPVMVKRAVEKILREEIRRPKIPLPDRLATRCFRNSWKHTYRFGSAIEVTEECTSCGVCVRICPVGNIALSSESRRPNFGEACVFCLGCLYACPASALHPGRDKYALLKEGYDLTEVEKRQYDPAEWANVETLCKGYLYSGLREYLMEARSLLS